MVFNHQKALSNNGIYKFKGNVTAMAAPVLDKPILKEFWHGYTFRTSEIAFEYTDKLIFKLGEADIPEAGEKDYAINVTESGAAVSSKTENGLIRGFITLMDMIHMRSPDRYLEIDCISIAESARADVRMTHLCIFHDTKLTQLQKMIRLCGALKYTHIVLEFWGTLQYDCLKELSWPGAYTKDEIRPLIKEANDLGMEVVPMFNHWGHASSCRGCHGKHVVLNQDPSLQYMYNDTGWVWNYSLREVRELMRKVRAELCELCGNGEYFHIGCDEARKQGMSEAELAEFCGFINEVNSELNAKGKRMIMWADMLLYRYPEYCKDITYVAHCQSPEFENMILSKLDKNIVMADWQYYGRHYPVETAVTLKITALMCFFAILMRARRL